MDSANKKKARQDKVNKAVVAASAWAHATTAKTGDEQCGWIQRDGTYTKSVKTKGGVCDPGDKGDRDVAMYHSHPTSKQAFKTNPGDLPSPYWFTARDKAVAGWNRAPVYMIDPDGVVHEYDPSTNESHMVVPMHMVDGSIWFWKVREGEPPSIKGYNATTDKLILNEFGASSTGDGVPSGESGASGNKGGLPGMTGAGRGIGLPSVDVGGVDVPSLNGDGGVSGFDQGGFDGLGQGHSGPQGQGQGQSGLRGQEHGGDGHASQGGPTGPSAPEREDYGSGGGSSKGNGKGGSSAGSQTGGSSSSKGKLPSAFGPKKNGTDGDQDGGTAEGNSDVIDIDIDGDDVGDGVGCEGDGVNEPPHAEPAPPADDGTAPPARDDDDNGDHDDDNNGDHGNDDDDNGDHDDDEDIGDHDRGYSPDESPFDLKTFALGLSKQFEQEQMWRELVFGPRPETGQEFDGWQQQHGDVVHVGRRSAGDDTDTPIIEHLVATYGDVAAATLAAREAARQALKFATGVFDPVEAQATSMLEVTGMVSKADGWGDGGADGS